MPKIDLREKPASYFSLVVTDAESDEVEELLDNVKTKDEYCDGWLPSDLADKFDGTYIILKAKKTNLILGFAILKELTKTLHIKVICSNNKYKGAGTMIIEIIKRYAVLNHFNKIKLSSIYEAIPFYQLMGFKTDCTPKEGELCSMSIRTKSR